MSQEDDSTSKELLIEDWLHNLNLDHLTEKFHKQGFIRVDDFKQLNEMNDLNEYEITDMKESKRIWFMLEGKQEHKDMFKKLDRHGLQNYIKSFIKDEKLIAEIVNQVPEHLITGFMLKDIFDKNSKLGAISKALYDKVISCKTFLRKKQVDRKAYDPAKEDESDVEKEMESIDFDLEAFFKDLEALECINMLQKQDINDSRLFFKMELATVEGNLSELKPLGKKKRVLKAVKEVKEKYLKEGKIEYSGQKLIEMPEMKFARSVTSVNK